MEKKASISYQETLNNLRPDSLAWHINEFDTNPAKHGLDKNWYKFHGIGFLMNAQMNLIPKGDEKDKDKLATWAQQTKRDILGFCLEYLSKGLVFAYKYKIDNETQQLIDPLYGNRSAVEMIDVRERGGIVKENMQKIQEFFLDPKTPDGAIAVVPSPKGPSGLMTDDGKAIDYLTSFWFVMQKKKGEVVGSTIKTDFTNLEYRAMIKTLTGKELPFGASLQDFVREIALINPNERREKVKSVDDFISLMKQTKFDYRKDATAFEGRSWDEIYTGVARGEDLYNFNKETQRYVADFMDYVGEEGHSRLELQKAVGATLLRISKVFLTEQNANMINSQLIKTKDNITIEMPPPQTMSFGQVFNEVKQIRGCAGGGTSNKTVIDTIGGPRLGSTTLSTEDESNWFMCPKCEQRAKPPVGDKCPHCSYTKDDFIKEHPELAC